MEQNCAPTHNQVGCPRCHQLFACRADSIQTCQCRTVSLNEAQRQYISGQFTDCLCAGCLLALRAAYDRLPPERAPTVNEI